jgi:opacity protein-like surface antigen
MKRSTSLLAACMLAAATLAPASAADISAPIQPLELVANSAGYFGDNFDVGNNGNTFSDRFTFTVGDLPFNIGSFVGSISSGAASGLDITGFSLYEADDDLVLSGSGITTGPLETWVLAGNLLDPGSYYLQVNGTVVSDGASSFGGAVLLTPVPEPATLGMLAGGLGLVGWAARRRARSGTA